MQEPTATVRRHAGFRIAVFVTSAAVAAGFIPLVSWYLIPYDFLRRQTPEERFFVWEGTIWTVALMMVFLAASATLEISGLRQKRSLREFIRSLMSPGKIREPFVVVAVWLAFTGFALMAVATVARDTLAG